MGKRLSEEAAEGEKSERAPAALCRSSWDASQGHLGAADLTWLDLATPLMRPDSNLTPRLYDVCDVTDVSCRYCAYHS